MAKLLVSLKKAQANPKKWDAKTLEKLTESGDASGRLQKKMEKVWKDIELFITQGAILQLLSNDDGTIGWKLDGGTNDGLKRALKAADRKLVQAWIKTTGAESDEVIVDPAPEKVDTGATAPRDVKNEAVNYQTTSTAPQAGPQKPQPGANVQAQVMKAQEKSAGEAIEKLGGTAKLERLGVIEPDRLSAVDKLKILMRKMTVEEANAGFDDDEPDLVEPPDPNPPEAADVEEVDDKVADDALKEERVRLKLALGRVTDVRSSFVLVTGKSNKLVLSKGGGRPNPKLVEQAKRAAGGGALVRGRAVLDGNAVYLETPVKPKATWKAAVKRLAKACQFAKPLRMRMTGTPWLADDDIAVFKIEADGGGRLSARTAVKVGMAAPAATFPIQITALDETGAALTDFTGTVSITAAKGTLDPTTITSAAFTAGVLTGQQVKIKSMQPDTVLTVAAGTVSSNSAPFAVLAPVEAPKAPGRRTAPTVNTALPAPSGVPSQDNRAVRATEMQSKATPLLGGFSGKTADVDTKALAALTALSTMARGGLSAAELKTHQTALANWLEANKANKDSDQYRDILFLHTEVRREAMDVNLEAKKNRNTALTGAADHLPAILTAPGDKDLLNALAAYKAARNPGGPRDGTAVRSNLEALQKQLDAWVKANGGHGQLGAVQTLLDQTNAELADILATEAALNTLGSKMPTSDTDAAWTRQTVGGMLIGPTDLGKAGTSAKQAREFFRVLQLEAGRSDAYAELLKDLINNPHPDPVQFLFGENSAGFGDDKSTMAVDTADLVSLLDTPRSVTAADGSTVLGGVTKGELLMHVIEERFFMQQYQGTDPRHNEHAYDIGHNACLSPDSMQNRHRQELGIMSDSLIFDCHAHEGCRKSGHHHAPTPKESQHKQADFIAVDSKGVNTVVEGLYYQKTAAKDESYARPDQAATRVEGAKTWDQEIDARIAECLELIKKPREQAIRKTGSPPGAIAWTEGDAKFLLVWLQRKYDATAAQTAFAHYQEEIALWEHHLLVRFNQDKFNNQTQVVAATNRGRDVLAQPPQNDGSRFLAERRAKRPSGGLNDAAPQSKVVRDTLDLYDPSDKENCACTTLGAITGKKSSEVTADYLRRTLKPDIEAAVLAKKEKEYKDANRGRLTGDPSKAEMALTIGWRKHQKTIQNEIDDEVNRELEKKASDYSTVQDQTMWYRGRSLKSLETKLDPHGSYGEDMGDAQLTGLRSMLVAEAQQRNGDTVGLDGKVVKKGPGEGGMRWKVVQDGLNKDGADGKFYDVPAALKAQMDKFPDGTQYQVFLTGPEFKGHWIYAEKYNGQVVMEDYQKATIGVGNVAKAGGNGATAYTGADFPHSPTNEEKPDIFKKGMFIAICLESYDAQDAWAGNPDWPQL